MGATLKLFSRSKLDTSAVVRSIHSIIDDTPLMAMGTASRRNIPHINNAFFFLDNDFRLGFLSFRSARHIRNVVTSPKAAVSIASSNHTWGQPLKGVQLFGSIYEVDSAAKTDFFGRYIARFSKAKAYCDILLVSTRSNTAKPFYFEMRRFKLIDEPHFGEETYIHGYIQR